METSESSAAFLKDYLSSDSGISGRIQERRELAEKLEADKDFREKYIAENKRAPVTESRTEQNNSDSESIEGLEALIQRLNNGNLNVIDDGETITAVSEKELKKRNKNNIVINVYSSHVKIYNNEK